MQRKYVPSFRLTVLWCSLLSISLLTTNVLAQSNSRATGIAPAGAEQTIVKTPNLDRIARQGTRFTRFYAGSMVCVSSRCALMTGKHMGHAYVRGNGEIPLRASDTTLARGLPPTLQFTSRGSKPH